MTLDEVERLIKTQEGRLCIRLYKRSDGTVIAKDCPVGLRAYQKRATKFAGAAFAAILGLFSISVGQKDDKNDDDSPITKIEKLTNLTERGKLSGTLLDPHGAVIPGAVVELSVKKGKTLVTESDSEGVFVFSEVEPSNNYKLKISSPGFKKQKITNLKIGAGEHLILEPLMEINGEEVTVGILAESFPLVDIPPTSITHTFTKRKLNNFSHRE